MEGKARVCCVDVFVVCNIYMGHSMSTRPIRPAPTSQTELIFGTFTDHNMIKLYMDGTENSFKCEQKYISS